MTGSQRVAAFVLPVLAAALAYGGTLGDDFVYDDHGSVFSNPRVVAGDWLGMAFGPDHTSLANRPFACLSIVIDHALLGMRGTGFRTTNLLLHAMNAVLVFAVTRRCLLAPNRGHALSESASTWTATFVATLWACHPLTADAVAYITQRSTLLMSLCLLTCLYAVLRCAESPRPFRWRVLAVAAMALGMASKEDLVTGPLLVLLFDRAFVAPTWRAVRDHWRFHAAIASTWLVLAFCVAAGPSNATVGFAAQVKVSPVEWLFTQAPVVLHYARMAVWPNDLRTVYDWPIVRSAADAALPGLAVLALLGLAVWQWRRRPWLGWLGALFFLPLAATSTVMPIVTEVVAERRAYLPMLAVLVPLALAGARLLRARNPVLCTLLAATPVVAAIVTTRGYAPAYTTSATFWHDAYTKNDLTSDSLLVPSILSGHARALNDQKRGDEALALLDRAMQHPHRLGFVAMNYAAAMRSRGRPQDAERELRKLLADEPDSATAQGALAAVLVDRFELDAARGATRIDDPRLTEAADLADRAYRMVPKPEFLNTRGMALCRLGRLEEAEFVLRLAVLQDPGPTDPQKTLGAVLLFARRPAEAIAAWQQLLPRLPNDAGLRMNLAAAHLKQGDALAARKMLDEVLRIAPDHAEARRLAGELK